MSKWRDEVEAAVHPVVHYVSSVQPTLIMEVPLKLIVNVLDDGLKAEVRHELELITPKRTTCGHSREQQRTETLSE